MDIYSTVCVLLQLTRGQYIYKGGVCIVLGRGVYCASDGGGGCCIREGGVLCLMYCWRGGVC